MSALTLFTMPPPYFYNKYIPNLCIADQKARMMNIRGLQWCISQKGRVIGDGQCTRLVDMHLAYSSAIPGDFRDYRNYIWGAIPNGWAPGDVLQFEQCYFEWKEGNGTYTSSSEHHSAIIVSLRGNVVDLVQQNVNGGPVVVSKLDLSSKKRGTIRGWRPVGNY